MDLLRYEDATQERLLELLKSKESFEVIGLSGGAHVDKSITEKVDAKIFDAIGHGDSMGTVVCLVEKTIESLGMTCRIFTAGRIAAAGGTLVGGITGAVGLVSAVGIAVHNIATWNPDYEISKHVFDNKIKVSFKK